MAKVNFYDLDGTLSKLNNTFDFIYRYCRARNLWFRHFFGAILHTFIHYAFFLPYTTRRKAIIKVLFFRLPSSSLERYFEEEYKAMFMKSLTDLGKEVMKKHDGVILTACVEVPARQIAGLFGLRLICTEFRYSRGKIIGIKKDTYGNLKLDFIRKKKGDYYSYYTDDLESEKRLTKVMDKIVVVR